MQPKSLKNSSGIDFNSPVLKRRQSLRLLKDRLAQWAVAMGGLGVIAAILMIFFYLLYEVAPLLKRAELTQVSSYQHQKPSAAALYLSMNEQAEMTLRVYPSGVLVFRSIADHRLVSQFQLPLPKGSQITRIHPDPANNSLLAAGLSNGQVILFTSGYKHSWPNDQRVTTPQLSYPFGKEAITLLQINHAITDLSISNSENQLLIAASSHDKVAMIAFTKQTHFLSGETRFQQHKITLPPIKGAINHLLISPDQRWLYSISNAGLLTLINIADPDHPKHYSETHLTEEKTKITAAEFLLGGISLLTGDDAGNISQWFIVRSDGQAQLQRIRQFKLADNAISHIIPEHRRKGFLAIDHKGIAGIYYPSTPHSLLQAPLPTQDITQVAIAPRGDYLVVDTLQNTTMYHVENEHPEISWAALWDKIWYESYNQPDYVWQSSASNNDFEPKLSLTPLAFGTLKAAFYTMLLATPLAICAAIYTAYFMAPTLRRKIKPTIELMEALPTVILGFLAGLWLAPLAEHHLVSIFTLLIIIPIGILLFAYLWDNLSNTIKPKLPEGWQPLLLVPVVVLLGYLALWLDNPIEGLLFQGDLRAWLALEAGIPFDQRNALIVGIAMGFAVIPTIYSIAEDAIFSVPKHLSYGSLALGATPWQTLTRVVLLTASPGIFSAVMIGMGRAVGETMIVLMATGNTPIMDANIFEGMRTLAASIAVEIPESEVGSSHYRVLFLAALVLFLFTFILNTLAEMIRQQLRKKYSSL
ncbi:ABC transporter permease subunit [Endozoicomonas sp.]|nr:ABC transporter permease subunit [Endozoicomonas sp.]